MSWSKYRERCLSPELSASGSKDSINGENHQEDNIPEHNQSLNSNHESWIEDPEPSERRTGMKQSDCVPFLVQLIHSRDQNPHVREGASSALRNIIHTLDDKKGREKHIFDLLEQLRDYCEVLKMTLSAGYVPGNPEKHPNSTMASLLKLSFNENFHRTICYLGGLQTIAELIEFEHAVHGSETNERNCIMLRRDSGMTLASLTVGDSNNKALLCSFRDFIKVWVKQLFSPSEELRQVTASVFCNLSYRADNESKQALREAGVVTGLMKAALRCRKESSLKTILSALWNLSAHCTANKAEICAIKGALEFLVNMLCYESHSRGLSIAENAGGIIRNVSSHIAVREDYRAVLRQKNCIHILIGHLKSPSLTVISNACGTLWNLSARCPQDQKTLWELGAVPLLRNLGHSKHKMISTGASSALRNLLTAKGGNGNFYHESKARKHVVLDGEESSSAMSRKRDSLGARAHVDVDVSKGGCMKKNFSPDSMYRFDRGFVPIDARATTYSSHDQSSIKQRSVPTAYISSEPGKKLKFCIKMTSDSCQYREGKGSFSPPADVPWNSPPDMPSCTRPRLCSPVEENNDKAYTSSQNFISRSPSDSACDEDISDQPVDYSKKYSERNPTSQNNILEIQAERTSKKEFSDHEDKVDIFGDYVETDLDQPTDYSLRYAEDDTDEDEKENPVYFPRNEQEDTVKTYCTEGTPYQTPLNFSTATSMSDLRVEESKEGDAKKFLKKMDLKNKNSDQVYKTSQFDESQEMKEENKHNILNADINLSEKPVSYCVEGTPRCFSRVSSLSSLGSAMVTQNISIEVVSEEAAANNLVCNSLEGQDRSAEEIDQKIDSVPSVEREKNENRIVDKEGKIVTFGREDHFAEQTPLMFSRCSSLGSLGGFEQHSIRDDLSSGVSDFSRMTSGVVSPSELPDSPTQTVPPSPRQQKQQSSEFGRKSYTEARLAFQNPSCSKTHSTKRSVFEDEMAAFKDESTPLEFSAATSLSSLTIDDEPKLPKDLKFRVTGGRSIVPETIKCSDNSDLHVENIHVPELVREDESGDIHKNNESLVSCMKEKLQKKRYSNLSSPQKSTTHSQPSSNLRRYGTSFTLDRLDPTRLKNAEQCTSLQKVTENVDLVAFDSVHVYCTEDTPDGSISNLSALSMPSIPDDNEHFDHSKLLDLASQKSKSSEEGSNLSGTNGILEEHLESEDTKNQSNPQSPGDLIQTTLLEVPLNSCNNSSTSLVQDQSFKVERSSPEPSEDSVSLTEEENNKLDQLIESAMPKRRLNDSSTSPASSQHNLDILSPMPSEGSNSFTEEESNKLNQSIESPSLLPVLPILEVNNRPSTSSLHQDGKVESSSPVPSEDSVNLIEESIKVYQLMNSEMPESHLDFTSCSPTSPRSPSPVTSTAFYRLNPCGRSSTPTTMIQPTCKDSPSPVPSEDSISLTEEENIRLDQFIESAMPKRPNALSPSPRSASPKLLINKSNYNSPSRRLHHSSSQSEILLGRDVDSDFTEDENNRLDQLIESAMPKKRSSVSSRSSPVNAHARSNPYSDAPLSPLMRQQHSKTKTNRDSMNDFAITQEDNLRFNQLIQSTIPKKRQNHSSKTSPIKVQMDNRPNKLNAYNRSSFNSTRHNFSKSDKLKPELDDDAVSLTEEDNIKLDEFIESAMPKKQPSHPVYRSSGGRVLDDIPSNRILPYDCSPPPSSLRRNSYRTGRMKHEQNENRNSLTEEENLRLDKLIESGMPKKRVNNSPLKSTSSKVPVDGVSQRSNSCCRSPNPSLRRHSYGNVGKWKYYKRLSFSRILRFIRESYP